jgi:hypothetical protein
MYLKKTSPHLQLCKVICTCKCFWTSLFRSKKEDAYFHWLVTCNYGWKISFGSYVGDYLGNVKVLKLDQESCHFELMKYTIPLSASHGETHFCALGCILPIINGHERRIFNWRWFWIMCLFEIPCLF